VSRRKGILSEAMKMLPSQPSLMANFWGSDALNPNDGLNSDTGSVEAAVFSWALTRMAYRTRLLEGGGAARNARAM
jgi:hypothetical protein